MSLTISLSFKNLGISLLLLGSLVLCGTADDRSSGPTIVDTTLCELLTQPHRFKNKLVRVKAHVESDLIEHTLLTDESCNSHGVSLWIPHDLDDHADVLSLRNLLKEQWKPGAAKTRVLGVFTGTFSFEGKKRFLKVSKIEDIRVSGG